MEITCSKCGAAKETKPTTKAERLPRGWKRHNGVWCDKCWRNNFVLRAITIPVVRPLGEGVGWPELREDLTAAWSDMTCAANWMTSEIYSRDVKREPGQAKIAKMPPIYLYPEATKRFPELPTQTLSGLEQAVKRKWGRKRYEVLWTCESSTPNARYPQPATATNQSWTPSYEPAGKNGGDLVPCVTVTIRRGKRYLLQLRGGQEFRRQLNQFRQLVNGHAIKGELALIRKRADTTRSTAGNGRDSGGQKFATRLMCKMVGWFPRREYTGLDGTLSVKTDTDSFLVALDLKGEKLWCLHADHVQRWTNEHMRRLNRLADDQKAEQRPTAAFQSRREQHAKKFRNRMDSFIQESASQLANFARRRKYATVKLDDTIRTYFRSFEWSGFFSRLKIKLDEYGIALELASGEVVSTDGESLAETEVQT